MTTARCQLLEGFLTLLEKRTRRQKQPWKKQGLRRDRTPEATGDILTRMVAKYPSDQMDAWCDKGLKCRVDPMPVRIAAVMVLTVSRSSMIRLDRILTTLER
jgi:hypothetical protein